MYGDGSRIIYIVVPSEEVNQLRKIFNLRRSELQCKAEWCSGILLDDQWLLAQITQQYGIQDSERLPLFDCQRMFALLKNEYPLIKIHMCD